MLQYLVMNHVQIGYLIVGITIFYQHVLASIESLSLLELCLILFDICYIAFG